ncbi:Hypothetical predicted protein [Octopus vulgaris]|uniref:Uncharacterized protein n=1 Tax=Octopus vulgaris TaxID=6645 RepID=A0AA36F6Z3_OCTVU|nr:Hypothetical predicted protein [Octopus vulgaris]
MGKTSLIKIVMEDTDVFESAGITSIKSMILKNQMKWSGHIVRIVNKRTLIQLFYGEFSISVNLKRGLRAERETFIVAAKLEDKNTFSSTLYRR